MLDMIFMEQIFEYFLLLYLSTTVPHNQAILFHFYIFDGNYEVSDDTGQTQRKMEDEVEPQMSDS